MTRVIVYDHETRAAFDGTHGKRINAGVWIDGVLRATLRRSAYRDEAELRAIPAERLTPRRRGPLRAVIYHGDPYVEAKRIVLNNLDLFSR